MSVVKIIECPRDAMQGIHQFIPTATKVEYLQQLLKVGFHTLDFGSFVSPKAIPQMQDTWQVIPQLDLSETNTKLLAIVANLRGAEEALTFDEISYLGYPFSLSETFQMRNTKASMEDAFVTVAEIQEMCLEADRKLVVYFSMAFGNPYNDLWDPAIVSHWADRMEEIGIEIISLADTVGIADAQTIGSLYEELSIDFPNMEIGAHLHTSSTNWLAKLEAAYNSGCRRFDGAIKGFGGCPFAKDELVGNLPTEKLKEFFESKEIELSLDKDAFAKAYTMSTGVFTPS